MDILYPAAVGSNVRRVTFDKPGASIWRATSLDATTVAMEPKRSEARSNRLSSEARLPPQWRFAMPDSTDMKDHVYKILELVGSSEKGIEDAIQNAVTRASKTIRDMKWFEVVQTRGHIENGSVRHYQVTLRVGFTLER
jgi:hypothetical protein